jgi:hypothetical protein
MSSFSFLFFLIEGASKYKTTTATTWYVSMCVVQVQCCCR